MSKRHAAVRLKFDDDLQASLRRINRPRRSLLPHVGFVLCVAAAAALALGGWQYVPWPAWPGGNGPAVVRTCAAVLDALKTGNPAALDRLCADGETGKALLAEDNRRLANGSAVHAAGFADEAPAGMSCFDFLENARRLLTEQGVAPGQITPLAFGGIEAKLLDTATMIDPAVSVTGELYFQAGARIYGLEFTARKCEDSFVITNFWRCLPVDAPEKDLMKRSSDRYAEDDAKSEDSDSLTVKSLRRLFIPLSAAGKPIAEVS